MALRHWTTLALAVGLTACSGTKGTGTPPATTDGPDGTPVGDDDDTVDTQTSPIDTSGGDTGGPTDTQTTDTYVSPTTYTDSYSDSSYTDYYTDYTVTETGGSSTSGFVPKNLLVSASLVIDGPNALLTTASDPNSTTPLTSYIALQFGDDKWASSGMDPGLTDDYCVFLLPLTNSAQASWLPAGAYFGVDYDPASGVLGNCGDATHPMDALFPGYTYTSGGGTTYATPAGSIIDGLGPWGAGIGPATSLVTGGTVSTTAIGGLVHNSGFLDPGLGGDIDAFDHYLAIPLSVDATFTVQYDTFGNPVLIAPADVFNGTDVTSGVDNIFDFYYWTFAI